MIFHENFTEISTNTDDILTKFSAVIVMKFHFNKKHFSGHIYVPLIKVALIVFTGMHKSHKNFSEILIFHSYHTLSCYRTHFMSFLFSFNKNLCISYLFVYK